MGCADLTLALSIERFVMLLMATLLLVDNGLVGLIYAWVGASTTGLPAD